MRSFDVHGNPVKFDIDVLSRNNKKDSGGRVLQYTGVQVSGLKNKSATTKHNEKKEKITLSGKDPQHNSNLTLNLYKPGQPGAYKIKVFNITRLNGNKVI